MKTYTEQDFIEWMNTKPFGSVLGVAKQASHCPVANFYKEKTGIDYYITHTSLAILKEDMTTEYVLPKWCGALAIAIDLNYNGGQEVKRVL